MTVRRATSGATDSSLLRAPMTRRTLLTGTALAAATGLWLPRSAHSQPIVPITPTEVPQNSNGTGRGAATAASYFPETGHNVKDPFLSFWSQLGGEDVIGPPLSEERFDEKTGVLIQHFRGISLSYNPIEQPVVIRPVALTGGQRKKLIPNQAAAPTGACRSASGACLVAPTGFSVSGRFLNFWQEHGEAAFLGNPVSEPFTEGTTRRPQQVFENAVLEETTDGVRLFPVWDQIIVDEGLASQLAFVPAPPNSGETFLVNASDGLNLRTEPSSGADILITLPSNAEFIAAPGNHGEWVPGYVDGFAGWVSAEWLTAPPPLPQRSTSEWKLNVWQGAALGETNVREKPDTKAKTIDELAWGDPVEVTAWVKGEEVYEGADLWAQIGKDKFVYGRNIGRNAPVEPTPPPPGAPTWGKWIDVNLTQQLMVAYENTTPVHVCETTTGMAGWETPSGWFAVNNRVPNETMTSGAIGAEHYFKLENVLFTQYFTDRGHAIHFAWWRTPETIGRPGSHGCLNLLLDDARFYWDWADYGTAVIIHP